MHLQTHALASWLLAETGPASMTRRDRALVLAAGLAPDLDALSLIGGIGAYQKWHHLVLHNVGGAAMTALVCVALARSRLAVLVLSLLSFHLHLLLDLLGSGGPDGSVWSIPYLVPFTSHEFSWRGQWPLGSWQNVTVTALLVLASWAVAVRRGRTVVEAFSPRADAVVVELLKRRWPFGTGTR
jgi:putative intracellular protease/amidase